MSKPPFRIAPEDRLAPWVPRDPSRYTHIETLARKAGMSEKEWRPWQEGYAREFSRFGVFVSEPDEIPGFRRIVVMDPGWSSSREIFTVLAIDDTGLAREGVVPAEGLRRPGILEIVENAQWEKDFKSCAQSVNLNRFSKTYREEPVLAANELINKVMDEATDRGGEGSVPGSFLNPLRGMVIRWTQSNYRLAAFALRDALDADIMKAMRSLQTTRMADAMWFSGSVTLYGDGDVPESVRIRNRMQAVRAYPLMADAIRGRMSDLVDRGEPLNEAVASHLDIPESQARRLRGVTWQMAGCKPFPSGEDIRNVASAITIGGAKVRSDFVKIAEVASAANSLMTPFPEVIGRLCSPSRPLSSFSDDEVRSFRDASDMLRDLDRRLLRPAAIVGAHARKTAASPPVIPEGEVEVIHDRWSEITNFNTGMVKAIFNFMPLKDMIERTRRWHRNVGNHLERTVNLDVDIEWAPLLGEKELSGGVTAKEIDGTRGLTVQGQMEGHCVGGYDGTILNSSDSSINLILSLEKDGEIIGTLHANGTMKVKDDKTVMSFSESQLRGHANYDPSPEARKAASEVLKALTKLSPERVSSYLDGLSSAREKRAALVNLTPSLMEASYNYWDRGELETAWSEYSAYLPRQMRKAGLDALISTMAEADVRCLPREAGRSRLFSEKHKTWTEKGNLFEMEWDRGEIRKVFVHDLRDTEEALVASFRGEGPEVDMSSIVSLQMESLNIKAREYRENNLADQEERPYHVEDDDARYDHEEAPF